MADSTVWAPMPRTAPGLPIYPGTLIYWDAYVPKVWEGRRQWDKDGPAEVPTARLAPRALGPELGIVYRWAGPRLVQCSTCNE